MGLGTTVRVRLSPSRLEVSRPGRMGVAQTDASGWASAWSDGLRSLDAPLAEALADAGVGRGGWAEVVYDSPDCVAEVISLPLHGAEAASACELRVRDVVGDGPIGTAPLPSENPAITHTLATADRAASCEVIAAWLGRAGLRVSWMLPAKAASLFEAAERARALGDAVVVVIESHGLAIAGATGGQLLFARASDTGLEAMADALARALRSANGQTDPAQGWQALTAVGVPARNAVVDAERELRGEHLLPLLQPAVQRLAVEIKQTVRYGLGEVGQTRARIVIAGLGARVPGLAPKLSALIETDVTAVSGTQNDRDIPASLRLVPPTELARRARSRLSVACIVGLVCALGGVAAERASLERRLSSINAARASLRPALEHIASERAAVEQLLAARGRVGAMSALLDATIGGQPAWDAVLNEIAARTPPTVRLDEVVASSGVDRMKATLKGVIASPPKDQDPLREYLDRLSASPLLAGVELAWSRVVSDDGQLHFQVVTTLVPLRPLDHAGPSVASAQETSR